MLTGFQLHLYMGQQPVGRDVIDALTSVQITTTAGQRSGFQLTFSTAKAGSLLNDLVPSGYFDPLTRVQIVVTLAGTATILFDGMVARQDVTPSNEPGAGTLTVTGEDISLAMDLIDFSGFPYPCMPMEPQVLICLAKYSWLGLLPEVIPSIYVMVRNPLEGTDTHIGTDLGYIKYLADKVGYVFYVEPGPQLGVNTAYWGPEIRYGETQPALTINMDAHTNVDSLSFSYDGMSAKLYAIMARIPYTTFHIPVPLPGIAALRPRLAERQPIPFKLEILRAATYLETFQAAAVGLAKASMANDALTGNGTLNVLRYGRLLKARSLVDVRGAGRAHDGTYYVKSVTHNIKRGEYKQSFSLVREGLVPTSDRVAV